MSDAPAADGDPLFVVFLDALDDRELPSDSLLAETRQAGIDSPVLNVTPCILGPMLTGERAGHHNLVRATRLWEADVQRPANTHLIEEIPADRSVMAHNIPFTADVHPESGAIYPSAPRATTESPIPHLQVTRGDFSLVDVAKGEAEADPAHNATVDYIRQYFANVRNLARNGMYDVFVLSLRDLDSFTHFYDEGIRASLLDVIDAELRATVNMGGGDPCPLLWFSDHGARPKTDCFRLNRWLAEKGYLDLDIHMAEWRRAGGDEGDVTQQIDIHSSHVQVNDSSVAYSCDAFDATVDVLGDVPEATVADLRADLADCGAFDAVYHKADLFDPDAPHFGEIPELIPQRRPGLMASGNVHPDAPTWNGAIDAHGYWRTGVHRRDAAVLGATRALDCADRLDPVDVYDVLRSFVDGHGGAADRPTTDRRDQLDALGYI